MTKTRVGGLLVAGLLGVLVPAPARGQFTGFTVKRENSGTTLTQTGGTVSTNTFDSATVAGYTSLAGSSIGTYTAASPGFGVFNDQYGGSGTGSIINPRGTGTATNYFSTGGRTSPTAPNPALSNTATLSLGSTTAYFFGLYWTAIDAPNQVQLFNTAVSTTTPVLTITAAQLLSDSGIAAGYNGNNAGQNTGEKYVYINIYANDTAHGFNQVVFSNGTAGSGFESDSHSFATSLVAAGNQSGTTVVPVTEPVGLLTAGLGGLVAARRLRRR